MLVVTGLYTVLIPAILYALFGSSRHLVVGAYSATAAVFSQQIVKLLLVCFPRLRGARLRIEGVTLAGYQTQIDSSRF